MHNGYSPSTISSQTMEVDGSGPAKGRKRKFVDGWENIDPCIKKVEDDPHSFQCTICKRNFTVHDRKKIHTHLKSKDHIANRNGEPLTKKKYAHKFLHKWTKDPRFEHWIQVVPGNEHEFRCAVCNVSRSCVSGVNNVERHAFEDKNHIALCKDRNIPTLGDIDPETVYENNENFKNEVEAEFVKFVKLGNELGLSFVSMGKILNHFKKIDPSILQHMNANPKKISKIARNSIDPLA